MLTRPVLARALIVAALGLTTAGAGSVRAQEQHEHPSIAPSARIVSVVGCGAAEDATRWVLINARADEVVQAAFSSATEIDEFLTQATPMEVSRARTKPLGTSIYMLIGTEAFVSLDERLLGHKVLVKGFLVNKSNDRAIAVTFVRNVADTCE